jgi:hypothetical protein
LKLEVRPDNYGGKKMKKIIIIGFTGAMRQISGLRGQTPVSYIG